MPQRDYVGLVQESAENTSNKTEHFLGVEMETIELLHI